MEPAQEQDDMMDGPYRRTGMLAEYTVDPSRAPSWRINLHPSRRSFCQRHRHVNPAVPESETLLCAASPAP